MRILHLIERQLSPKASELVQFDMDSIRQVVASGHGRTPDIWLIDPEQYESHGRLLRDSPTPRLLAYSAGSKMLYVTDGCNSCAHELPVDLTALNSVQLQGFALRNNIRMKLLEKMARECAA